MVVVVWMLAARGNGGQTAAADVQIIPPDTAAAEHEAATDGSAASVAQPAPTETPVEIMVYLTGEVVHPDVYRIASDRRLIDVVILAGGPTENADLDRVNLASYVTDAGHYRIPTVGQTDDTLPDADSTHAGPEPTHAPAVPACVPPLDINTATADCLETLPGIGHVRAQSIVSHRDREGPFATADGITAVSGIGNGIYGRIAGMIIAGNR